MNTLVIDASIAIKWVVGEDGTPEGLVLREKAKLIAPDLLVAECANILRKRTHDLRHVTLRYFNVAGADRRGRTGQSTRNATHLIKVAVEAALGLRSKLDI